MRTDWMASMGEKLKHCAAVIFDMDGVLVDSEAYYLDARAQFLREESVDVSREELVELVGASVSQDYAAMRQWFARSGRNMEIAEIASLEDAWWEGRSVNYKGLLNSGVEETLFALREMGIRLALASSSPLANIVEVLAECGISDYFEVVVSGEQFHESKPNPEIYLHTLERLGLPACECCCVEDSVPGITAGKSAGLFVCAKRERRFGFSQNDADVIIDQIADVLELIRPSKQRERNGK